MRKTTKWLFILLLLALVCAVMACICACSGIADDTDGVDGSDGKSAYEIWLDEGYTGSQSDFLEWLKGSDGLGSSGEDGQDGVDGKSAYQIWLDNGNTGTEADFLEWLKGQDGYDGQNGSNGKSAYQIWLDNGNTGTEADFLEWLKGQDGYDGQNGSNGKSAYQIWLDNGNTGTEADFLEWLRGADGSDGKDGVNGSDGKDGENGLSAYEIWLNNGNTGSEEDFLEWLKNGCSHNYGGWTVIAQATCTNIGVRSRTCSECGYIDYEFSLAFGHESEYINSDDSFHTLICEACNQSIKALHEFEGQTCVVCGYVAQYSLGLDYVLNSDNTYSVAGIGTCSDSDLVIPSIYKGNAVAKINNDAFLNNRNLKSVIIPDSVSVIADGVFYGCCSLESVTLSRSLKIIGESAFFECGLSNVEIPESVTEIGAGAFGLCESLTVINYNAVNAVCSGVGVFSQKSKGNEISLAIGENVKKIPEFIFKDSNVSDVTFAYGNTCEIIGKSAFCGCTKLTEIEIPESVINIGDFAFTSTALENIKIGTKLINIGKYAFNGCSVLKEITIPKSVANIGEFAFAKCNGLTIYCESESEPIGWESNWNGKPEAPYAACPVIMDCKNTSSKYQYINGIRYYLSGSVATVYRQPTSVKGEIVIPEVVIYDNTVYTVLYISDYAFYNCKNLESIKIPYTITSISNGTFENCSGLISATLPNGVKGVEKAFNGCDNLTIYYV